MFHTFLLRSASENSLSNQISSSSSSVVVDDEEEYELNDVLYNRIHRDRLQYNVIWTDHLSNNIWYSAEKFVHVAEILADYHEKYSK